MNVKTILFQVILFSISTHFSSIELSGATTPGQSGPGSDCNEGVLRIPQSFSITGTSPSDYLVSYPGNSLVGSYPSTEMRSVYSTAPAVWARNNSCSMFSWIRNSKTGLFCLQSEGKQKIGWRDRLENEKFERKQFF